MNLNYDAKSQFSHLNNIIRDFLRKIYLKLKLPLQLNNTMPSCIINIPGMMLPKVWSLSAACSGIRGCCHKAERDTASGKGAEWWTPRFLLPSSNLPPHLCYTDDSVCKVLFLYICVVNVSLSWCLVRLTVQWTLRRVSVLEWVDIPP